MVRAVKEEKTGSAVKEDQAPQGPQLSRWHPSRDREEDREPGNSVSSNGNSSCIDPEVESGLQAKQGGQDG